MRFLVIGQGFRVLRLLEKEWPRSTLIRILDLDVALTIARAEDISMVMLEIPQKHAELQSRFCFIESLRAVSDVPIVVFGHIRIGDDRTEALNLGVDRCVPEPFSDRELVAHIRAVLRLVGSESYA